MLRRFARAAVDFEMPGYVGFCCGLWREAENPKTKTERKPFLSLPSPLLFSNLSSPFLLSPSIFVCVKNNLPRLH